jgi:hypothetical protein
MNATHAALTSKPAPTTAKGKITDARERIEVPSADLVMDMRNLTHETI